jgi:TRAP-type C4-dicarboxylate transport system substrate-binding protein
MKKIIPAILLLLALNALFVGGCNGESPAPAPAPAPAPPAEKPIELKMIYHFTAGTVTKAMIEPWADQIMAATNGRINITHYPGSSLVRQEDEYDAIESGLADMACFVPSPGRFPLCEIVSLPKLFPSGEVTARVYNEIINKYLVDTELKNVKVLWVISFPPLQLVSNKPVHTIEDFKGMKIWTTTKVEGWMNDKLGTSGINLPVADLYNSLERGLIDGLFFAWDGSFFLEFYKVTDYRTQTNMFSRAYPVVMNMDVWNSLPDDIKAVFNSNGGPDVSASYATRFDASEASWRDKIAEIDKEMGKDPVIFLSAEEDARWQEFLKPIWTQWVTEMEGKGLTSAQAMLDDTASLAAKYSK